MMRTVESLYCTALNTPSTVPPKWYFVAWLTSLPSTRCRDVTRDGDSITVVLNVAPLLLLLLPPPVYAAVLFVQVYFDIDAGGKDLGRLTLELRADVVPKTAGACEIQ